MSSQVRGVTPDDLPPLRAILERDPVTHCFVTARLDEARSLGRLGADLWVFHRGDEVVSALYVGANVIPIASDEESRAAFAERLRRTGRRGSSIVGPADEVLDLWSRVQPAWGPAREVRACQPLLSIAADPRVAADPHVRAVREDEIDVLLPACVAMFTEEVGVSPVAGGSGSAYRARIAEIVRDGRAFARVERGAVVFKAEIGVATAGACQVQGVWVAPGLRGTGLSEPGMAAVVQAARRHCAPVVSLYVNDYNVAARRTYAAVGFSEVGTFATILF